MRSLLSAVSLLLLMAETGRGNTASCGWDSRRNKACVQKNCCSINSRALGGCWLVDGACTDEEPVADCTKTAKGGAHNTRTCNSVAGCLWRLGACIEDTGFVDTCDEKRDGTPHSNANTCERVEGCVWHLGDGCETDGAHECHERKNGRPHTVGSCNALEHCIYRNGDCVDDTGFVDTCHEKADGSQHGSKSSCEAVEGCRWWVSHNECETETEHECHERAGGLDHTRKTCNSVGHCVWRNDECIEDDGAVDTCEAKVDGSPHTTPKSCEGVEGCIWMVTDECLDVTTVEENCDHRLNGATHTKETCLTVEDIACQWDALATPGVDSCHEPVDITCARGENGLPHTKTRCKRTPGCMWSIEEAIQNQNKEEKECVEPGEATCDYKAEGGIHYRRKTCEPLEKCKWVKRECIWDPALATCEQQANGDRHRKPTCEEVRGCRWWRGNCIVNVQLAANCERQNKWPGRAHRQRTCDATPGCVWKQEDDQCVVDTFVDTCGALKNQRRMTKAACERISGCTFRNNRCLTDDGAEDTCDARVNGRPHVKLTCEKVSGCEWWKNACQVVATREDTCEEKANGRRNTRTSCVAISGCRWKNGACEDDTDVASCASRAGGRKHNPSSCLKIPSCKWQNGACADDED